MTAPADPELVVGGLSYPTSLAFDDEGSPWVAEAGLAFGGAAPGGRVWRLVDGERQLVVENLSPPVNGLFHHEGSFFVSVGGHPSRIIRVWPDGRLEVVLEGLPGPGDYQTNMAVVGPDGWLYFSQGAMTNSGVIGLDSYQIGWLSRLPHSHDLPGLDVVLAGVNVVTADPRDDAAGEQVATGAFVPFGTPTQPGQRVPARLPCTAAVMRCGLDGSDLELVAWGLRNAYGLGFLADGRLVAVDQGADDRGSRPIGNAPDLLHEIRGGSWCGWPDFVGDEPVTHPRFRPQSGPQPTFLLDNHDELPPPAHPLAAFPPHSAATKFAVAPPSQGPWSGHLFVTLFGDEVPLTAPSGPRMGRGVVRVDPGDWSIHPLAPVPCSRPIDVGFHPGDGALHVLDFGRFEMTERGVVAEAATGRLWRLPGPELQLSSGGEPS
ncbi:MAG: sugar dehydrogenase [Actinomycetota bacterium]|nr:sugar dehydrogenase [Actinomycetota bacterium]